MPTLQERRAIIHAATEEMAALTELVDRLQDGMRVTGSR